MRPPRMGTHRWMLFIGLVAVIMTAVVWQKLRIAWKAYCREQVEYRDHLALSWRSTNTGLAKLVAEDTQLANDMSASDKDRRFGRYLMKSHRRGAKYLATVADYHAQMTEKWKNATNSLRCGIPSYRG
jgi:hypothetical protein